MRAYVREMFLEFYPNADGLLIESSDYAICHCAECGGKFFDHEFAFVRQISDDVWRAKGDAMIFVYPRYFSTSQVPELGVSGARQLAQTAPANGAPQLAQNFPDASAPQEGQFRW